MLFFKEDQQFPHLLVLHPKNSSRGRGSLEAWTLFWPTGIKTVAKTTQAGKGLVHLSVHPGRSSRQEPRQSPQRGAAHWLVSRACSVSFLTPLRTFFWGWHRPQRAGPPTSIINQECPTDSPIGPSGKGIFLIGGSLRPDALTCVSLIKP